MRFSLLALAICFSTTLASAILRVREESSPSPQPAHVEELDEAIPNEVGQSRRQEPAAKDTSQEYKKIVDAWLKCYDHCLQQSMGSEGHINAQTRNDCVANECGELGPGGPGLPTPTYDEEKLRPWFSRLVNQVGDGIKHNIRRFSFRPAPGKMTMPKFMPGGVRFLPFPLK